MMKRIPSYYLHKYFVYDIEINSYLNSYTKKI